MQKSTNRHGIIKPNLPEGKEVEAWYDIIRKAGISYRQLAIFEIIAMVRRTRK